MAEWRGKNGCCRASEKNSRYFRPWYWRPYNVFVGMPLLLNGCTSIGCTIGIKPHDCGSTSMLVKLLCALLCTSKAAAGSSGEEITPIRSRGVRLSRGASGMTKTSPQIRRYAESFARVGSGGVSCSHEGHGLTIDVSNPKKCGPCGAVATVPPPSQLPPPPPTDFQGYTPIFIFILLGLLLLCQRCSASCVVLIIVQTRQHETSDNLSKAWNLIVIPSLKNLEHIPG